MVWTPMRTLRVLRSEFAAAFTKLLFCIADLKAGTSSGHVMFFAKSWTATNRNCRKVQKQGLLLVLETTATSIATMDQSDCETESNLHAILPSLVKKTIEY